MNQKFNMNPATFIWILALLGCKTICAEKVIRKFPNDFIFGTATAAYQIEGAWNEDGKSENIWDHLTHNRPELITDQSNGDISADSYRNYKRDVEMMRELGVNTYRFSLSWSRLLQTGFSNQINEAAVLFYNNYINEMMKYNITPMVTLYHWDLPQKLQDLGGFTNPLISDWFEDYARVAFALFGDRVKLWITMNEPREICYEGYGSTTKAPALGLSGIGDYLCAKHLVTAHAKAYHAYNNDFKPIQGGKCGITISIAAYEPYDSKSEEDQLNAELKRQAEWGLYADPIFSEEGGFPKELVERVAEKSAQQGFKHSRIPSFTEEEKAFVRGTNDFFGVNHYSGSFISHQFYTGSQNVPSMDDDVETGYYKPDDWYPSVSSWLQQMPDSLFLALKRLKDRYNNPTIYITENGWSTRTGLNDDGRVRYCRAALESALDAIDDGINLKGYMAWSLLDNFEWMFGYTERFGIYEVDLKDPKRTRTPRKSAFVYKNIVKTRTIDYDYNPDPTVDIMTID